MTSGEYNQLVEFLGRQFTEIDRRFGEMDRRFSEVDRRFDEADLRFTELRHDMLGHFDEIYRQFERLEQEYHAITQALCRIEAGLADERGRREILERDLAELKQHVAALQSRIEELESASAANAPGRSHPDSIAPRSSSRSPGAALPVVSRLMWKLCGNPGSAR